MAFRSLCLVLACSIALAACGGLDTFVPDLDPLAGTDPGSLGDWTPVYSEVDGLERFARTEGERLIVSTEGGERDFQAGVNMGATVPGHFPGELAVSAQTYRTWFAEMAAFGFTSIRIYTMLPPHFYEQLREHNLENPDRPLLLLHGVWPPVSEFLATSDLHDPAIIDEFRDELSDVVDVVHGNAVVEDRPGRASGHYTADVSPWVVGWAIGSELEGQAVLEHDRLRDGMEPYSGTFFESSADASPTESWLAMMLDHLAAAQVGYGETMPLSFVNWVTTDPLEHPYEPLEREDLVGIDPMAVRATDAWPGGYFASYHVYPYYPDFLRYEPGVADYVHAGEIDPYAGLLKKYADHHAGIPLMVLEYGVPTGMAKAHSAPHGRDQGDHSEQEQAVINADLLETIADLGLAGAYVFSWTDEWFKLTWNTMDYEVEDRRPMWMNAWTNEAHFGLVVSEPRLARSIVLDGVGDDWMEHSQVLAEGRGAIREIRAAHDEGYVYVRVVTDRADSWVVEPIEIGFDVIDGGGAGIGDGVFESADYRLVIDGDEARVEVRSDADPMLNTYASFGYFPAEQSRPGGWNLHRLITNRPYTLPITGTETVVETDPAGLLHHGTTDVNDAAFDSRSAWFAEGEMIELRIPWQAIGFSDPSQRMVFKVGRDGIVENSEIDRIGIAVATGSQLMTTDGYRWEPWSRVEYTERIKAGAAIFASKVIELGR